MPAEPSIQLQARLKQMLDHAVASSSGCFSKRTLKPRIDVEVNNVATAFSRLRIGKKRGLGEMLQEEPSEESKEQESENEENRARKKIRLR